MAFKPLATSGDTTKRYLWLAANWGQQFRLWVYVTADSAATVAASAYITDQSFIDTMETGDFIFVLEVGSISDAREVVADVGTGGLVDLTLHVVTENTGAVIDLSDDLLSGGSADLPLAGGTMTGAITLNTGANTDSVLDEDGIDRASGSAEAFNIQNSGAGAITLQVDGVTVLTISSTSVLTNKTIDLTDNTVTGTTAEFNAALSDGDFATLAGSEILTNKTMTAPALNSPTIGTALIHDGDTDNKIAFGTDTQDMQTGGSSRLDISDSGVRLGAANARVTTILDEDAMGSDSATALATQQSIKKYIDDNAGTVVIKTADETVNNSTTLQDDDHLLFAMAANTTYAVEATLLLNPASATPDFKFGWTVPSGGTMFWHLTSGVAGWAGSTTLLLTESSTESTVSAVGTSGIHYRGIVRNGSTAGNLQLQWAQDTAHASDNKVLKHSHLIIRNLGAT